MKSYFATVLLLAAASSGAVAMSDESPIHPAPQSTRRLRGGTTVEHIEDVDSYTEESIFTHNDSQTRAGARIWDEDDEEAAAEEDSSAPQRKGLRG